MNTWRFIPGKPIPEMAGKAGQRCSLYVSTSGAVLQLGAQWTVSTGLAGKTDKGDRPAHRASKKSTSNCNRRRLL